MRKKYIAGNWKMNMSPSEGSAFAKELVKALGDSDVKVMVAPPYVTIPAVLEATKGSKLIVAAQNMANHESGAYTGEISPLMLKDLGVRDVILGHSERRSIYGESDEVINEKLLLALKHDMDVVFCIGETLQERESGRLEEVLERQVRVGLQGVLEAQMPKITIAYEPVWAIGTGKTATPDDANNAHAFVRSVVEKLFSKSVAEAAVIQYGGSVKASNAEALMTMPHIDGALVGGASLSVEQFLPIVNFDK
ncbi:MAG: triose-phosphate isomerase [Sphaerochaeta sp.]